MDEKVNYVEMAQNLIGDTDQRITSLVCALIASAEAMQRIADVLEAERKDRLGKEEHAEWLADRIAMRRNENR